MKKPKAFVRNREYVFTAIQYLGEENEEEIRKFIFPFVEDVENTIRAGRRCLTYTQHIHMPYSSCTAKPGVIYPWTWLVIEDNALHLYSEESFKKRFSEAKY